MRTKPVLTASDAAKITAACQAEVDARGWLMSVAVVDDAGRLLSVVRFDGASYASPDVALRKAETAAMTRKSTEDAEHAAVVRPTLLSLPGRLPLGGGLPVMLGTDCVGAIGVSGGRSEDDIVVAKAGLNALQLDLPRT